MKFKVREGMVCHVVSIVEVNQNGQPVKQEQVQSYWEGQTCDLTEEQARAHAHKLEPLDKPATALLDGMVLKSDPAAAPAGVDIAALAAAVAAAIAQQATAKAAPAAAA